jgi:hypothetical protein
MQTVMLVMMSSLKVSVMSFIRSWSCMVKDKWESTGKGFLGILSGKGCGVVLLSSYVAVTVTAKGPVVGRAPIAFPQTISR